ncbi:GNAT family N-acetyltransferase [Actinomycetospora sp. OC33-EN08]|uniref:GNAT family N-acetyltransferase n=1 Tax=Actinomycetospora aurantiaca TaxID=3129233 RepID=A0ABU8MW24_9PSEU
MGDVALRAADRPGDLGRVVMAHGELYAREYGWSVEGVTARGLGVGRALVRRCVDHARAAGYARLVLWTNAPLAAARAIYLAEGFTLVGQAEHDEFGVVVLGQDYELALTA